MKRSAIVIAATAAGLAAVAQLQAARHRRRRTQAASTAGLTTGNANVTGAQTVVGSDQSLAGNLGDIQVKVTASNGKIVSVGMAKMNLHGPQSQQISQQRHPAAGAADPRLQRRPHPGRLRRHVHEPGLRALAAGRARQALGRIQCATGSSR